MAMFAGGGSRTITINNTSQKVAKNLNARLPWSDVAFTNGCPAELAPGLSCMMTFSSTNSARHTVNDIVVFGSNVPESPFSVVVLGLGDTYQEGVIFQIDAGANSGKVALPEDTLTLAGATESQWSPTLDIVGTDDDNGLANTIAINDLYGTDSAAGLCFDLGTASGSQWYLPALNELDELINVALLDVQGDPFNINTQPWYWDSSEVVGNEMNEANQARFQFVGGFVDSRTQTKTNATGRVQCIHQFSN